MDLRAAAASHIERLPDVTPAARGIRPWGEWIEVARVLRSKNTRLDQARQPAPMTWHAVAAWILENDPRAAGLKAASLAAELSTLTNREKSTIRRRTRGVRA